MSKIRVLIVDDSFFIRKTLTKLLSNDDIEVIDTAENGLIAVQKVAQLKPDIVTMDIEMPIMNGLEAVKEIMAKTPVPILMVSTLTSEGAESTFEALSLGAIDFITKKASFNEIATIKDELVSKIMTISQSSLITNRIRSRNHLLQMKKMLRDSTQSVETQTLKNKAVTEITPKSEYKTVLPLLGRKPRSSEISIIVIGISTGGPAALNDIIPKFSADIPVPILIAQHMPPFFTKSLAERLNLKAKLKVKEAEMGEKIVSGTIYIAPGGKQMTINTKMNIVISDEPADELYKPSVNVLTDSVVSVFTNRVLGIMMTGMGHDGGIAFQTLHKLGGYIIVQDPDTCVVAGMTKTVIDLNIANEVIPLNEIPNAISSLFGI